MRFVAHISRLPPTVRNSFWDDVGYTEEWLVGLGKEATGRTLTVAGHNLRQLESWWGWQQRPAVLEGWIDLMSVEFTWRYLEAFLVDIGPRQIHVPCGGESEVQWSPGHLVVRAPEMSWLWPRLREVWARYGLVARESLDWQALSRAYRATRLPYGYILETQPRSCWNEWHLTVEPGQDDTALNRVWADLVQRLGVRSLRVRWYQEMLPRTESLLGLPVRMVQARLTVTNPPSLLWDSKSLQRPSLRGLRCHLSWEVPEWSRHLSNTVVLRRWRQGTRLEAHFRPRTAEWEPAAYRALRRERRQLPVFAWAVSPGHDDLPTWESLQHQAHDHQQLARLAEFLNSLGDPGLPDIWPPRIRYRREIWKVDSLASVPGQWTISHGLGPKIVVSWPRHNHVGWLSLKWGSSTGVALVAPLGGDAQDSLNQWRYWAWVITMHLMPQIENWLEDNSISRE